MPNPQPASETLPEPASETLPKPASEAEPETLPEPEPRRLRILVVDDHDVVHWGFRLMLGQMPWVDRCLSARTGAEALAVCRRYEPHVALVDLFLGPESGPEICERLRAEAPAPRVLLMSGAGGISPRAARAAGAAGFISKDQPAPEIAKLSREPEIRQIASSTPCPSSRTYRKGRFPRAATLIAIR